MKKVKVRSGKASMTKTILALIAGTLIVIGAITVVQKGKAMINDNDNTAVKTVKKGVNVIGNLFGSRVWGIYKCQSNINLIDQFEFKLNGTGYFKNFMNQEFALNYKVDGARLVVKSGDRTDVYKISNGEIVLPLDARCTKK